jgi:hypothetical protein
MSDPQLRAVIRSVRPALAAAEATEDQREQFLYDLAREVYDYVKFDVYGPDIDAPELRRFALLVDAALPRPELRN